MLSEQPDWSALLRLVAQAAGPQIVLNQFQIIPVDQSLAGGVSVRVGGLAADPRTVSSFALSLEEQNLFARVHIETSRREPFRDRLATAFTLRCTLAPGQSTSSPPGGVATLPGNPGAPR